MSQNDSDHQFDASEDNESQPIVEKKRVQFNEKGQPIGVGSAKFATFVGKMARMHCPPTYSDWPSVPEPIKETIWNVVFEVYDLEPVRRVCVLHKANTSWKDWKYKLRKIYDEYPTNVERKRNIPRGMRKEDWENFVDLCSLEDEQIKREIGREAREHMILPHTSGRRGSARTEEQLIKESSDGKVTRTRLFLETHITKDGTCPKVNEIKKLVSVDPYLGERDLDNDPVALVCGHDGKGRVRALGGGVSKTMINASAPFREIAEKEKRNNENAETKFNVCMQKLEEETKARKLLEEKLATYMNGSTDSNNASQARRRSSSLSSDSSVPASTRCLLKNFRKKVVALGNVCTDVNPSDDSYSVRIDGVFDSTTELYVGEGTLGEISFGDTITWHKNFVEFI